MYNIKNSLFRCHKSTPHQTQNSNPPFLHVTFHRTWQMTRSWLTAWSGRDGHFGRHRPGRCHPGTENQGYSEADQVVERHGCSEISKRKLKSRLLWNFQSLSLVHINWAIIPHFGKDRRTPVLITNCNKMFPESFRWKARRTYHSYLIQKNTGFVIFLQLSTYI